MHGSVHMAAKVWGVIVVRRGWIKSNTGLRPVLGAQTFRIATIASILRKSEFRAAVCRDGRGMSSNCSPSELHQIPGLLFDLRRRMRPAQLRTRIGLALHLWPVATPVNTTGGQGLLIRPPWESRERRGEKRIRGKVLVFKSENGHLIWWRT